MYQPQSCDSERDSAGYERPKTRLRHLFRQKKKERQHGVATNTLNNSEIAAVGTEFSATIHDVRHCLASLGASGSTLKSV